MMKRWRLRPRWPEDPLRLLVAIDQLAPLSGRHDCIGSVGVGWMIEQRPNVVDKQRIQHLRDFLLIRKVQRTIERNPGTVEKKKSAFDHRKNGPMNNRPLHTKRL